MSQVRSGAIKAGFQQNGGSYYVVISSIATSQFFTYSGSSGSGGSAAVGTFAAYTDTGNNWSSCLTAGKLIKDVGRTVVSSGRTFRKFQAVVNAGTSGSTFGVAGKAPTSTDTGYLTGYLEIGIEGLNQGAAAPLIARMS